MAEPADINVDELRRRARRRLVGAVVLALGVAVIVPMLLETEQKPLGDDVSVKVPPIDESRFVNRLNDNRAKDAPKSGARPPDDAAKGPAAERAFRYDTRIPDAATSGGTAPAPAAIEGSASAKTDASAGTRTDASTTNKTQEPTAPAAAPDGKSPPPNESSNASTHAASPAGGSAPAASTDAMKPSDDASKARRATTSEPKAAATLSDVKAAAAHDGFAVQLAAFADDKGANALAGRLKKAGYAAYTEPLKTSKGTLWRVRVGPYPSREAAVAARDKLKTEGQSGIVAAIK